MKAYFNEPEQVKLKKFAAGALKKIGSAWDNVYFDIEDPMFKKGVIKFDSANYHPMRMEVLGFILHMKQTSKQALKKLNVVNDERWFISQGLRKDCVYFLKWLHPNTDEWEFMLDKHVCGMRSKF